MSPPGQQGGPGRVFDIERKYVLGVGIAVDLPVKANPTAIGVERHTIRLTVPIIVIKIDGYDTEPNCHLRLAGGRGVDASVEG
jgi:hypothetical protein